MASNHEDVLYFLEQRRTITGHVRRIITGQVRQRVVFRTRTAAREYRNKQNEKEASKVAAEGMQRAPSYLWVGPFRAEWGPDNA